MHQRHRVLLVLDIVVHHQLLYNPYIYYPATDVARCQPKEHRDTQKFIGDSATSQPA